MERLPSLPLFASLVFCICLLGCSAVTQPLRKASHLSGQISLYATVDPDANQNMPVAVDVVAVSNKKVLGEVAAFTAQAWFSKRTDYLRVHPKDLRVTSWEWVPGEQLASVNIPQTAIADGILLFANYASSGNHAAVLPKGGIVRVEFGPTDFKVLSSSK